MSVTCLYLASFPPIVEIKIILRNISTYLTHHLLSPLLVGAAVVLVLVLPVAPAAAAAVAVAAVPAAVFPLAVGPGPPSPAPALDAPLLLFSLGAADTVVVVVTLLWLS